MFDYFVDTRHYRFNETRKMSTEYLLLPIIENNQHYLPKVLTSNFEKETILAEAYLETCQTSRWKKTVNYFRKKTPP